MTDPAPAPATPFLAPAPSVAKAPDLINVLCIGGIVLTTLGGLAAAACGAPLATIVAVSGSATAVFAAVINRVIP